MNPTELAVSGAADGAQTVPRAEVSDSQPAQSAGDPRVGIDEAVAALDELGELPLSAHVERFEAVHTELTAALSSIDRV